MLLRIVFSDTEQTGDLEESDDVLGPDTTWLDVKGLIKMWTGEPMSKQVLFVNGDEVSDHQTLEDTGLTCQEACDKAKVVLTLVEEGGSPVEFSHEDFLKAQRLAGKGVPVTAEQQREEEVRRERRYAQVKAKAAPRARPAALDARQKAAAPKQGEGSVKTILEKCWHGMRREGVDKKFQVSQKGITQDKDHEGNPTEPFEYWDLRLMEDPEMRDRHGPGEVVCELFYFGFHMPGSKSSTGKPYPYITDPEEFKERIAKAFAKHGLPVPDMEGKLRDAGCLYPLVAVPARMSEADAMTLGHALFEDFGKKPRGDSNQQGGSGQKGGGGGCAQQ
eukprot:TRINITY_DN50663_c0_g1_i1.p1 TRINITY_DN50663_c0_g1~~TRINITY_DN50663_c0_g1_i1.p1  ORF type:complete len:333 (+),score=113.18 TRINITY_DN50663_c0_g1_i1:83-1081(+)